jgi:hypothetical protein
MKILLVWFLAAGSLGVSAQPVIEKLEGPDSVYTGKLVQILKRWTPKHFDAESVGTVELTCIATANEERYIGMVQRTTIRAGILAVESVLDDVAHYQDLFPDTVDVHVVPGSRSRNGFVTSWKQRVPVFFLPDVTYELGYQVDKTTAGLGVYRYKLRQGDKLVASDGMVVLEATRPDTTQFTEYDFFDARWGLLPAAVVWRHSLRVAFLSDMAVKLKSENPTWSYKRIALEAEQLIASEGLRFDQCFAARLHADLRDTF